MKIFLTPDKFLKLDLTNYYLTQEDIELEILRDMFLEFALTVGELPVYDIKEKEFELLGIFSNIYVFNRCIISFANNYGLKVELPDYMLKEYSEN